LILHKALAAADRQTVFSRYNPLFAMIIAPSFSCHKVPLLAANPLFRILAIQPRPLPKLSDYGHLSGLKTKEKADYATGD
jgi:hypothetical protein